MDQIDSETFELINRISEEHSRKKFGYLDEEDLKQEIWVICLGAIKEYNSEAGPLENWLRVIVKNRLVNKFKDITKSVRSPCPRCPYFLKGQTPDCEKFDHAKELCDKWKKYQLSVTSRNSLLNSAEEHDKRFVSENFVDRSAGKEIVGIIKDYIGEEFLYDFSQLTSGGKISNKRLERLKIEINRVMRDLGYQTKDLIQLTIKGREDA